MTIHLDRKVLIGIGVGLAIAAVVVLIVLLAAGGSEGSDESEAPLADAGELEACARRQIGTHMTIRLGPSDA